jgi:Eco57I restriction-modification methylase
MPKTESLDELIAQRAAEFADQIRAATVMADKEEEIRIEVEKQLAFIQKDAGVKLEGRHEFTVAQGRADSVYQRVIIEYKNPKSSGARIGPKSDSAGTKKVVEQLKNRFYDMQSELGHPLNSMFGVGLDGNYFVFVRYRDNKWQPQEPLEVNKYSAERFLWALYNLGQKGKPFSSEYLAGDFGSASPLAQNGVRTLYEAISTTDHPKAQVFFNQWKILFGEVCGYEVNKPSDKINRLAKSYNINSRKKLKPSELLFSLHTYYAIFMKLLASSIVTFFRDLPTPLARMVQAVTSNKLKREVEELELGSIFRHFNITNFLEGDLFAWYTSVWSDDIEKLIRDMVTRLDTYNPGTLSEDPAGTRDLLKKLYQQLFPQNVRHDLGEYYTPDWLAEHVLSEIDYTGNPDKRLLDPACGSGTFLVLVINRIRNWYDENRERCRFDEGELLKLILSNVIGFDLNPLAVMAARTNYLIAIRGLTSHGDKIEIPVYLCDSIMTPSEHGGLFAGTLGKAKELETAAAKFIIPTEIASDPDHVAKYAEQLEFGVRNGYSSSDFIERCRDEGLAVTEKSLHIHLYDQLAKLDRENKNGVWARIIKNSFAPIFVGKVDYIVGNPPWIAWLNLPSDYRQKTSYLWSLYKIFPHKGLKARLGSAKDDLSILFTYVSADNFLNLGGRLGFVITQSLFKSKGGGQGFRRWQIGDGDYLGVVRVDDMVTLKPFEGATNRTAVLILDKGKKTNEKVPYFVWTKKEGVRISPDSTLDDIRCLTTRTRLVATNIDAEDKTSPWITGPLPFLDAIKSTIGPSEYVARMGACFGATGVFWVNVLTKINNRLGLVRNVGGGKKHVEITEASVEWELIYPILRGRDIDRWGFHVELSVLFPQDEADPSKSINLATMRREYPRALEFLSKFESLLRSCAVLAQYFDPDRDPFYSIYNVGSYSFAPYKILWSQVADELDAVVISSSSIPNSTDQKIIVPDHSVCSISFHDLAEAHYVCACLNSVVARSIVKNYIAIHPSPNIMHYLPVALFNPNSQRHQRLAELSRHCHTLVASGELNGVKEAEREINTLTAKEWGITATQLEVIDSWFENSV